MMQALQTSMITLPIAAITYFVCSYIFDRLTVPSTDTSSNKPHQRPAE